MSGRQDSEHLHIIPQRCARVGCSQMFLPKGKGQTKKRFCSKRCQIAEAKYKRIGKGGRRRGPENKLVALTCSNGHPRMPYNTVVQTRDGHTYRVCRDCKSEADLRYRSKKPTKPCPRCGQPKERNQGVHLCQKCSVVADFERRQRFNEYRRQKRASKT